MTIEETLNAGLYKLKEAGIDDADIDAFLLLEAASGLNKAMYYLYKDKPLEDKYADAFSQMIERRVKHEPCQYITGNTDFMGFKIKVNRNVLIPRQDTETVVCETLRRVCGNARVLDMCTGSGAIAIAMQRHRPDLSVTAADISKEALELAKINAKNNQCLINLIESNLFENINPDEKFDCIISNPPYVTDEEYESLMSEVKDYEPELALKAGKEGLDVYKRLIPEAKKFLKQKGFLALEIGCFQAGRVCEIMSQNGYKDIEVVKDLAGLDRCVTGYMK